MRYTSIIFSNNTNFIFLNVIITEKKHFKNIYLREMFSSLQIRYRTSWISLKVFAYHGWSRIMSFGPNLLCDQLGFHFRSSKRTSGKSILSYWSYLNFCQEINKLSLLINQYNFIIRDKFNFREINFPKTIIEFVDIHNVR